VPDNLAPRIASLDQFDTDPERMAAYAEQRIDLVTTEPPRF
jgi:hypothetical protein